MILIFYFYFFTGAHCAFGIDYYVAKNGNDPNPGSEAQPWLTIQHAAVSVSGGDTVYVKEGTYNETVTMTKSGSSENSIVFEVYGADSVTLTGQFNLASQDFIVIRGFNIRDGDRGIYENAANGNPGSDYITIENCVIQNTTNQGIHIARGDYVTVNNCTIKDTGAHCIRTWGDHWVITNNDISNPGNEDGIHYSGDGHRIAYNYIHNINGTGHADGIQNSCGYNVIVEYNIIENARSTAVMQDCVIETENACDACIYRYNLIYHTQDFDKYGDPAGIGNRFRLYHSVGLEVIGNIFDGRGLATSSHAVSVSDKAYSHPSTVTIKNNIFYNNPGRNGYTGASSTDIDYNLYFNSGTPAQNNDFGSHSFQSDPKFENADNSASPGDSFDDIISVNWLRPDEKQNSPAIDAGTFYSGRDWQGLDIAHKAVPQGSAWDIGAYEFHQGPSPPTNLRIVQ